VLVSKTQRVSGRHPVPVTTTLKTLMFEYCRLWVRKRKLPQRFNMCLCRRLDDQHFRPAEMFAMFRRLL
jgi:hypothetical protein